MNRAIPFTQFHLPNGRQSATTFPCDETTWQNWERAAGLGFRMTVEIIANGKVSMCVEDPDLGDFDCVVCENGPAVPESLKTMLARFNPETARAWQNDMRS